MGLSTVYRELGGVEHIPYDEWRAGVIMVFRGRIEAGRIYEKEERETLIEKHMNDFISTLVMFIRENDIDYKDELNSIKRDLLLCFDEVRRIAEETQRAVIRDLALRDAHVAMYRDFYEVGTQID